MGREQRSNNFLVVVLVTFLGLLRSAQQVIEEIRRALELALQQIAYAQGLRAELPDLEHHLRQHSMTPQMCTEGTPDSSYMQLLLQQQRPDILDRPRSQIFTQNDWHSTARSQHTARQRCGEEARRASTDQTTGKVRTLGGGTVAEQETGADFCGGNSEYTDLNLPRRDPRRTGASPWSADDRSRQVDLSISDSRRAHEAHCNADNHNKQADLPRSDPGSADGSIPEVDLQNSDLEKVNDADVGFPNDDEGATEGHVEIQENSVQDEQNDRRPEYVQEVDSGFDSPTTIRTNPPGEQTAIPDSDVPEEEEDREMGRPWQPD